MNDIEHEYEVTLIDDGTLDTVVSVEGTEYRYNWDPEPDSDESYDDFAAWAMDESYDDFVEWAMGDAVEQHEQALYDM
jgi:hypothetical protein